MCKSSDVFSLAVLIDRGLDLCTKGGIVLGFLGVVVVDAPPLPFLLLSLFSSQGISRTPRRFSRRGVSHITYAGWGGGGGEDTRVFGVYAG